MQAEEQGEGFSVESSSGAAACLSWGRIYSGASERAVGESNRRSPLVWNCPSYLVDFLVLVGLCRGREALGCG